MEEIRKKIKSHIVQHNNLVHAAYDMTLYEMKIFLYMLSTILRKDKEFTWVVEIPVEFFTNADHVPGNVYDNIKLATKKLTSKVITVNESKGKKPSYKHYNIVSSCSYETGKKYVKAKFNDDIKGLLLELTEKFTPASLEQLMKFRSFYSYRIYMLLRERKDFKGRQISVDELRWLLQAENKYKEFFNFENRILRKAQEELANTDLAFKYIKIKKGRVVDKIKFIITGDPEPIPKEEYAPEIQFSHPQNKPLQISSISTLERCIKLDEKHKNYYTLFLRNLDFSDGSIKKILNFYGVHEADLRKKMQQAVQSEENFKNFKLELEKLYNTL